MHFGTSLWNNHVNVRKITLEPLYFARVERQQTNLHLHTALLQAELLYKNTFRVHYILPSLAKH